MFRAVQFLFDFENMKFIVGDEAVELSRTEQRLKTVYGIGYAWENA